MTVMGQTLHGTVEKITDRSTTSTSHLTAIHVCNNSITAKSQQVGSFPLKKKPVLMLKLVAYLIFNISKHSSVQLFHNKEHNHSFYHTTCYCLLIMQKMLSHEFSVPAVGSPVKQFSSVMSPKMLNLKSVSLNFFYLQPAKHHCLCYH